MAEEITARTLRSRFFFFKYLSANDCGKTASHQAGLYVPGPCWPLFLDRPGQKGENLDRLLELHWDDGRTQVARFIWYGKNTRSEYRLTRGFSFRPENAGDLFIIGQSKNDNAYFARLLSQDEEIDNWFAAMGLSPLSAGQLIDPAVRKETAARALVADWLTQTGEGFPSGQEISTKAREMVARLQPDTSDADSLLIAWLEAEYHIFCEIEKLRYQSLIHKPIASIDSLIELSHTILNRRKARAGQALENHLAHLFDRHGISYAAQPTTENKKRPDFIFPGSTAYHDPDFPAEHLVFLAAKTTCKDRWRQIIHEAERIPKKYLCTLQQGMSEAQLAEMQAEGVHLVIPAPYRKFFPRYQQDIILTVADFLRVLKEKALPGYPLFRSEKTRAETGDGPAVS